MYIFLWWCKVYFSPVLRPLLSYLQNFHPTAHKLRVIRVEHLRKEFHIPKHLLPPPSSNHSHPSQLFLLYQELGESGVSSSRVGLEPMFIFARHSYIRRTSQCTYITHPRCNRDSCEATHRCRNGTHTQFLTICESKHAIGEKTAFEI